MKISIIVPVFNEESGLEEFSSRLETVLCVQPWDWEILFVDDGSRDRSSELLSTLARKNPRLKVLTLSRNFGHQMALTAGIDHAEGDAAILMDSDLQHPPELIPRLVQAWSDGYAVVYAVRQAELGIPWFQSWTSHLFYRIFRLLSGLTLPSQSADFRLVDRGVLQDLRALRERHRFLRGLTSWLGHRSTQIPYASPKRASGTSKYSWFHRSTLALDGITSFSSRPLYLAIYLGIILAAFGFLYGLFALYAHLVTRITVPGWTSILSAVCLIGGIQLILLGVVGFYIGMIFDEVKQRPLYVIQSRLGFPSNG